MASSIKGTTNESLLETMDNVSAALKIAGKYDMDVEVIATAMIFLKENPDASIETALNAGLGDWDV
jgi:hypothetical protein